MKISARNQLAGQICDVQEGAVNGVVTIDLGGEKITADITMGSIKNLELAEGKKAYAVIKATNVMFATGTEKLMNLSARNQLAGKICKVEEGAVNASVAIELNGGEVVTGSITNAAAQQLGLEVGTDALAIVKATDVMVAVD